MGRKLTYAAIVGLLLMAVVMPANAQGFELITSADIKDQTIQSVDIGAGGVGKSEVRRNAVGKSEIRADVVGTSELAPNSVTTGAITNGSVREDDLDGDFVTAALKDDNTHCAPGQTEAELDLSTTNAEINDDQATTVLVCLPATP